MLRWRLTGYPDARSKRMAIETYAHQAATRTQGYARPARAACILLAPLDDTAQGQLATFAHLRDADYGKSEDAVLSRLIAIAVLMVAVAVPAFACERNKSAATDSQSTVASQSGEQAPHGRS